MLHSDSLSAVKLLRIGLLVLLAVLLPVRGAMAATMLCTPPGSGSHHESNVVDPTAHTHHGSEHTQTAHDHDHAQHDHGEGVHVHATLDKCNVCSTSCSSPPLPSAPAAIDEPAVLTSISFPDLSAPTPTFQSGGQERPPRTI